MATIKDRISDLLSKGKSSKEIYEVLKAEKLKTNLGTQPKLNYVQHLVSNIRKGNRKRGPISKKPQPTLLNVPIESPDNVCIVFGSSEKVERALSMLRDIYQSGN